LCGYEAASEKLSREDTLKLLPSDQLRHSLRAKIKLVAFAIMPPSTEHGGQSPEHHIELVDGHPPQKVEGETSPGLRSSKGWDGKLRVQPKKAVLSNPEAISDAEYSDDENVAPGEEVPPDEGGASPLFFSFSVDQEKRESTSGPG
jgi:hypothetical protein